MRLILPLLTLAFALAAPAAASAQSGGSWTCEGSALRGTVLGTTVEPVVANVAPGATCRTSRQALADIGALPLPVKASAVTAGTVLGGADGAKARDRKAVAAAGIADLRLQALPALPIQIPIEPLLVNVPTVTVPLLGITVDLKPAVRALLPDGRLPNLDLVSVAAISSWASGSCVDGTAQLSGSSQIAGLRVLGQELPVDSALTQTLNLLDTTSIDPSNLDLTKLVLPAGISLGVLQPLLKPILDTLPPIAIPAALAHVKVTPSSQTRTTDGRLVQRALRVEASLAGRPLLDLVLGEAVVGARDVDCAADPASGTAAELALGCTTRKLTLIDVVPDGRRVKLFGAADRSLAGQEVDIVFQGTNDVVATPKVREDGSFSATAPMPSRRLRATNRARYVAKAGSERSLNLKLARRMRVTGIRTEGGKVTIAGSVAGPRARRAKDREVVLTRRLSCRKYEVVGRGMPKSDGTFRITVDAPKGATAAVYRLRSKVQATRRNAKLFPTFTLPRAVDLL